MANHPQALKRAKQSERARVRNMAVKSRIRTRVRALRYAVDSIETLRSGKSIHPQEVEKHLRWVTTNKVADLKRIGFAGATKEAAALLKSYDAGKHETFLQGLAQADLKESVQLIDKAASKGVYHRRTASRKISRLTTMVNGVDPLK